MDIIITAFLLIIGLLGGASLAAKLFNKIKSNYKYMIVLLLGTIIIVAGGIIKAKIFAILFAWLGLFMVITMFRKETN